VLLLLITRKQWCAMTATALSDMCSMLIPGNVVKFHEMIGQAGQAHAMMKSDIQVIYSLTIKLRLH
jgi:hypothetical protein